MNELDRKTQIGAVAYFRDCIKNGDVKGALSCFDTDGVYVDRDGNEIRGLDQIELAMEQICALKLHITGDTPYITVLDDLAMWTDKWEMTGQTPDGSPIQMTGQTACVMKRNEEGVWLWMVDNPFGSQVIE